MPEVSLLGLVHGQRNSARHRSPRHFSPRHLASDRRVDAWEIRFDITQ
jgi:hypothetical protein